MWRWTKRALAGVIGLGLIAALGAAYQWLATRRDLAATPPPGQLVDIGGYRLHLWCMGAGAPAVVLESGLGGGAFTWPQVQKETAMFTRVCAYDVATPRVLDVLAANRDAVDVDGEDSAGRRVELRVLAHPGEHPLGRDEVGEDDLGRRLDVDGRDDVSHGASRPSRRPP